MFNFNKFLLIALFVSTIAGCGAPENGNSLTSSNDSVTTKTQEIIKGGITTDLNQMIKGDWSIYKIALTDNSYAPNAVRNILFDMDEVSVVGAPVFGDKFDPIKQKYIVEYFLNHLYKNDGLDRERKTCEIDKKGKFIETPLPAGTIIYEPNIFDVKVTYEIVKEGSDTKLRLNTKAKKFDFCCDLGGSECIDKDFSAPDYNQVDDFLVVGVNKDGFVLGIYITNPDGSKYVYTKSVFSFLKD